MVMMSLKTKKQKRGGSRSAIFNDKMAVTYEMELLCILREDSSKSGQHLALTTTNSFISRWWHHVTSGATDVVYHTYVHMNKHVALMWISIATPQTQGGFETRYPDDDADDDKKCYRKSRLRNSKKPNRKMVYRRISYWSSVKQTFSTMVKQNCTLTQETWSGIDSGY